MTFDVRGRRNSPPTHLDGAFSALVLAWALGHWHWYWSRKGGVRSLPWRNTGCATVHVIGTLKFHGASPDLAQAARDV